MSTYIPEEHDFVCYVLGVGSSLELLFNPEERGEMYIILLHEIKEIKIKIKRKI
jgi:hypothetical protein